MRLILGPVLSLAILAGVGAAGAEAAQRYAAPNAAGPEPCSKTQPCSLLDAVNNASAGDEVIVTVGEYTISGAPLNVIFEGLQIHGDFGGPMPRVVAALEALPAINLNADGSTLSYLEVLNKGTEAVGIRCGESTRVERVRSAGIGEGATGLRQIEDCLVRDSLLRGEQTNSIGMESLGSAPNDPAGTARNVTATATGESSVGIQSRYNYPSSGSRTLILSNSIASGGAFDLRAEDDPQGPGRIEVSNSNFDTVSALGAASISGPSNQLAPPVFIDAGAGDYREALGSPTIDAGAPTGIGALDLAGNPRALGAAPDIGAFEFVPAPAAGALTALSVTPKAFRPRGGGAAIVSKTKAGGKGGGAAVGYTLTAAANVVFTVERALKGRRVGGKCRKQTDGNRTTKRCARFRPLKGGFSHQGVAGENRFRFSGRIGTKALAPGRYRLVAVTGASVKRAAFRIFK